MTAYFLLHLRLSDKYKNPEGWTERENELIRQHFNFLIDLSKRGILVLAGRTDYEVSHKNLFGIALIKALSLDEAERTLFEDPAVKAGVQIAEIHPFNMAIENFENKL